MSRLRPLPPQRLRLGLLAGTLAALLGASPLTPRAWADDKSDACQRLARTAQALLEEAQGFEERGQAELAKGRAAQALQNVARAYSLCPTLLDACSLGVQAGVLSDDWQTGHLWLDRYTALTPYRERDPLLHYLRAHVQLRLVRRPDLAIRSLERMQALAPYLYPNQRDNLYYAALMAWGGELSNTERYEDAVRQFQTAALVARRGGKVAKERAARGNAGIAYSRAAAPSKAEEIFRELTREEPENPIWLYQMGIAIANQSRFLDAVEPYRQALAKLPAFPAAADVKQEVQRAQLRLGNCLRIHAGKLADPIEKEKILRQALEALKAYVVLRADDPVGWFYVGLLLFEELTPADNAGALTHFRAAYEKDPQCENFLRYLRIVREKLGAPPTPGGRAPTDDEKAAWQAEGARLEKEMEADAVKKREAAIKERSRTSGDVHGGCQ